jgi:hypothetical protein
MFQGIIYCFVTTFLSRSERPKAQLAANGVDDSPQRVRSKIVTGANSPVSGSKRSRTLDFV